MPRVLCDGRAVQVRPGQRLLDALLDAGLSVPSSCRVGACQTCLVRATSGAAPAPAQAGLKDTLRAEGYFLACVAEPEADLEITLSGAALLEVPAQIATVEIMGADVVRVVVRPDRAFAYRAGQFVTLVRADGLARAYSLASLPPAPGDRGTDALELHVRVLPSGRMSTWLAGPDAPGAHVRLRGPAGNCFYVAGNPTQPLVLAGTGTGLAPLWGILREALRAGHTGPIALWHGARVAAGLYLVDELTDLARRHPQLDYRRCVLDGAGVDGELSGRLDQRLLEHGPFAGHRVYLCGDPALVVELKQRLFLAGATLAEIHADPFFTATDGSRVGMGGSIT